MSNPIWNYYTKLSKTEKNPGKRDTLFAKCNVCQKVMKMTDGNTTGINTHLK